MGIFDFFNRTKPEQVRPVKLNYGVSGGSLVNEHTCMEVSAYYRGVIYISTQIAKLPWEVKDRENKVIENDISYMLNVAPNEEMTSYHLKLFLIQSAINTGNGYAEIERTTDGRPVKLWPLNPRKVHAIRDTDDVLWYEIAGGGRGGETIYMKPRDLFIVRNPHTLDGFQGQGLVAWAMTTLGIALGADKFANSLFANGGMPSGVLTHPGRLQPDAKERLAQSWKEGHGGKKTGSTAVLEDGVTYSPISHAPDVMQFLESRKFGVLEIARFLGLPPTKLFDTDSAKFANLENANLEVATDTLDAWARNLEAEADVKLLAGRKGGRRTELDLYAVFRGDMVTRSTYFKNMMSIGAMSPNEIRNREGMAPVEGMSRYFIATNNFTPSDRMDEVIDAQIKSKTEPTTNSNNTRTEGREEVDALTAADKAVVEYLSQKVR
jgi:HK97 family phage portal protein